MPRKDTYEATVMLRITKKLTTRLDTAKAAMEIRESDQGRGRKIGRATIIYEAALRGMKLLEKELFTYPAVAARMTKDEAGHVIIGPAPEEPVTALGDADDGAHLCS